MKDENKSREQLISELNKFRLRVSELDVLEAEYKRTHKALQKSHDELEKRIEEQKKELVGINERLRIIVESAQSIRAFSIIDEMGKLLLEEFARTMAAEGGSLYSVENNTLILVHSLDPVNASDTIPLPPKKGSALERVLKKKEPILISDIAKGKNTIKSGWDGYKDGSLIIFPISDEKGTVTTVISLHNKTSPPFVEQDKEIGLILASYSCEFLRTIKNTQSQAESEKLLQNILSASSVGIAYAQERKVAWANEVMEKMFGFEDEKEYLGQTTYQLYASEEEYQRVGKITYEGIEAGGDLIETDAKFKRKDGTVFDGNVRVSVVDPSNSMRGIVVSIIDISERKRAEELLKESEEKYRNLFENSIEGVFTVDLEGNFTSINRAVEITSGYSRDELIGGNAFNFMKPEFREEVYKKYNNLFRTGKPIEDLTYVLFTKTGEERTVEGYVNVIRKEDRIIGFQGKMKDITDRKAAEEKLKGSEERYRELVENIEDVVYVLDGKGNVIFFNKAAEKSIGYSKDELSKKNYKELITPESYKYAEEIFIKRLSGEDVGVVEHQFYNKKGDIVIFETRESFVWEGDRVVEVHGIGRDITERKKAEEGLRESEERYRNLVETSNDGIAVVQDGKIVFINRLFTQLLEYSEEDILGEPLDKFIYSEDLNGVVDNYRRRISGEEVPQTYELKVVDRSGQAIPVETNAVMINWYGKPAILSFLRDITERKQAEEALKGSEERFKSLSDASFEAIFVSEKGVCIDQNKTAENMFGYTNSEAVGRQGIEWIASEDREEVMSNMLSGYEEPYEVMALRKNGTKFPAEIQARMAYFQNRQVRVTALKDITKRKKTEEALRTSEEKYRTILENIDSGYFEVDIAGNYTFFNDSMCRILGYSKNEMLGMNNRNYMDKETSKDVYKIFNEVVRTKKTKKLFDWELIRKDKSRAFVSTSVTPIIDSIENVVGFRGIARDITDRKRAEEALTESEEKYRTVVENAKEAILVLQDGIIKFLNPKALEIAGYPKEEFLSQSFVDLIYPDDLERVMERHQRILNGEDLLEPNIYRVFRKGGNLRWVEGTGVSIDWEGRPASLSFFSDITEKKETEEALVESERKFRNLFETSQDLIFFATFEGKIVDVNPQGEELLGYTVDEFSTRNISVFCHDEQDRIELFRELTAKGSVKDYELILKKKDGTLINCLLTATIWKDDHGNILGYQGTIRDVTEKKKFEEQLIQAQKMEAVGALAGGMAHNFNNILVGIMGYSELLLAKKNENDSDYKSLKVIHENTLRASELTGELLNIARGGKFKRITININSVVEKVFRLLTGSFDKSIDIKTYFADNLMMIGGDAGQLEQSLLNLCINAQSAMPEGGELIIETNNQRLDKDFVSTHLNAWEGDYVVLSVTDTGTGISDEIKEHIFEPFFSTKEQKGGTGIGLSTVYGIVKNHDGFITIYSEEGEGSTFKLYFPVIEGKLNEIIQIKEEEKPGGNETILLVDDENTVLEIWSDFLLGKGYRVITAKDGNEAIDVFRKRKSEIDLVILDFIMPRMSGKEVLIKLRGIDPSVKVLVSSGYSKNGQAREMMNDDADGFIQKPSTLSELLKRIRYVIDQ